MMVVYVVAEIEDCNVVMPVETSPMIVRHENEVIPRAKTTSTRLNPPRPAACARPRWWLKPPGKKKRFRIKFIMEVDG